MCQWLIVVCALAGPMDAWDTRSLSQMSLALIANLTSP
jgi:hypothetical protein